MRGNKREQARVQAAADKWHAAFGLDGWWRINNQFLDQGEGDGAGDQATTMADWVLREVTFTWHLDQTVVLSGDELDNLVVHELIHCLVDPIAPEDKGDKNAEDRMEYAVESLARGFIRALRMAP